MAICEQCGKYHEGTYGSGRFCCRSCSNRWVALNQSPEAKSRKSEIGKKNLIHSSEFTSSQMTPERRSHLSEVNKGRTVTEAQRAKISASLKGRVVSDNTRKKLSDSMIKSVEEGRHKGFQYSKDPYSEKYIGNVLDSLQINYIRQYRFKYVDEQGRNRFFFLDFYLPDYNIDLEVDGSFHLRDPQLSMDKVRDSIVSSSMRVFRLLWSDPNSENLKSEINRFKEFITKES